MRHIFLLKPVDDDYDHHPFIETIREVMQGYDYDIFMSTYPDHAKKIIKHYKGWMRKKIKAIWTDHRVEKMRACLRAVD